MNVGVASLITASFDLKAVQLVRAAMNAGDETGEKGILAAVGSGSGIQPGSRKATESEPRIEPRKVHEPEPRIEPRKVLHGEPLSDVSPSPWSAEVPVTSPESSLLPGPCAAPWQMPHWERPIVPPASVKPVVRPVEVKNVGTLIDAFL